MPPTTFVDTVKDIVEDTEEDTGKDTVKGNGKNTKKIVGVIADGGTSIGDSNETVEQFISRLGLSQEEAEVVEDLLKTHNFVKEKDMIESVIKTAKD